MILHAEEVCSVAREYLSTPWKHTGRLKGVGIDCIGLVVCVLRETGAITEDYTKYSLADEYDTLMEYVDRHADRIPSPEKGCLLVFRGRMMNNHCGIYLGDGIFIHSYNSPGIECVVLQTLGESWNSRLQGCYNPKETLWPQLF